MSVDRISLLKMTVETISNSRLQLESPPNSNRRSNTFLDIYRTEVQRIFDAYNEFHETLQEMRELNVQYQKANRLDLMEAAQHEFLKKGAIQSKRLFAIKKTLDAIEEGNHLLKRDLLYGKGNVGTTELTIRVNVCMGLRDKLNMAAKELNNVQYKFKCDTENKAARFQKIEELACMEVREEDPHQNIINDENTLAIVEAADKFETEVLTEALVDKLKDTKKLEDNIMALHQLFIDLAAAVDQNSDQLNDIEQNVLQTNEYHDMINAQLGKVRRHQIKRNQGATKWLVIFLLIDIAIILAVIFS